MIYSRLRLRFPQKKPYRERQRAGLGDSRGYSDVTLTGSLPLAVLFLTFTWLLSLAVLFLLSHDRDPLALPLRAEEDAAADERRALFEIEPAVGRVEERHVVGVGLPHGRL
jgi:hypothetical protein